METYNEMSPKKTKINHYYRSLTRNMVITIIMVSFVPMFLVIGIIFYQFQKSYHEKVYAHLEELVRNHKQNIDSFLREKLGDIQSLVNTFDYEKLGDETFLGDRLTTLQSAYGRVFVDLGLVDAEGIQVAYAGPFRLGKAYYATADWFQKAMESEYFISDVFLGLRGLPHFIIAVKKTWNGKPWILRATIDFVAFNHLVENIRIGETGFAFILNRKSEFQTKPRLDIPSGEEPYQGLIDGDNKYKKDIRVVHHIDDSGRSNIYVAALLKDRDWLLVYQQNAADAFSDLNHTLKITLIIFLISGFGVVVVAFLLSRRMVNRISQADQEKERMNEQIIETGKLASVGELAAGIAHEINNPVAIMVEEAGWIEDLLEDVEYEVETKNLDEFRRAVEQIKNQGRRCKEITHKLLSFARKTDSRVQDVQVNQLIEEIVSLSAQRAKYSKVTIQTNLAEDLPTVRVSQSELQQVFLNLINNALDAMAKGGGIIDITSKVDGSFLIFEVTDNGPGIPEANLGRVFDPFFTTKPMGKGTGLGLSICYGIIKKMEGDIEVRSVVDAGTTFRVMIPLQKNADEEH
jgi:two-component system NtrC family sensor kinase